MRSFACAALAALAFATPARAQQPPTLPPSAQQTEARLRAEQEELTRLRNEREALERRMRTLQSTVRNMAEERRNLERQAEATSRVVRNLDSQLGSLFEEVENVNASLARSQDEQQIKRATLKRRVQEIYKRGPLYSLEALLSAESFGALVARYKYLHLVARRDRALLSRVETLAGQITAQRFLLVRLRGDMEFNRQQKADEELRLRRLEEQRGRTQAQAQAQAERAAERLRQLARDEQRLSGVIAALEESRRRAAARPNAAPARPSTLTTAELGRLDWPVDGNVIYRFGRVVNPNNTTTRWQGMGIAAPTGTAVRAVAAGEVVLAEPMGTYGLTVIVQHGGGGDYSVYSSLQRISARKGASVTKGEVVGTVGSNDPDMEPHLHFEMRPGGRAVDPLEWLRQRR